MIRNNKIVTALLAGVTVLNLSSASLVVAAETNNENNYTIKNGVLEKAVNLTGEVTLPDNITSIADSAFDESNENLTKLIIPGNIKKIGGYAFYNASNLKEVVLEEGLEEIDNDAFAMCDNLTSVTLPSSLKRIGAGAFRSCDKLGKIQIPDGITKLEGSTFSNCDNLTEIKMSSKLTSFGQYDFMDTPWFENLKNSNGLYIYNGVLLYVDYEVKGDITLPNTIKEIGPGAINSNDITSVVIPSSVINIREYAFQSCDKLTSVKLSENLKTIGKMAFQYCDNLKEIEIPSSVTSIGESAFSKNTKITGKGDNFDSVIKDMNAHKGDSFYLDLHRYPNGWITTYDGHKCYKITKGDIEDVQRGWMDLDGKRYYFYNNGWMGTGFIKLSDTAYYYTEPSTGELLTGWRNIDNKWYYFNPSASNDKERGWMQTSWKYLNGSWYFFYSDGTMATGFINPYGDEYYYLDESSSSSVGIMKTGWQYINGYWYYFNKSSDGTEGLMSKGWKQINGTWYYFYYGDGKMAANTWIDGYHVNLSGAWDR